MHPLGDVVAQLVLATPRGERIKGNADAAAGERGDGAVGEVRVEQVATYSLELLAVAVVGGGRGMGIHAEGGEG
ncbi:MAG TPA: hypothetical protein DCQ04_15030, partial [Actinobacteria bacterium]|nr:hypothetical protein [Actinomycetota bacterium]